ncbi:hypothetical protein ACFYVR_26265 [Rhodococcus sp. NPDC003318]|uniref:hypothetical protein n=1 Tax=Rhodococcus sp. NPDC003318 TaxID=3364503 RepID=UPI0036B6778A
MATRETPIDLETPCDGWLAAAPMLPALVTEPAKVAERLLLLLHYGIDWSDGNWVTGRRGDYWESVLPSRVRVATFTAADLHHWWTIVSTALTSLPRSDGQRVELAALLTCEPRPVLAVLRDQTPALVLRTRIVADAVRASAPPKAGRKSPTPTRSRRSA